MRVLLNYEISVIFSLIIEVNTLYVKSLANLEEL